MSVSRGDVVLVPFSFFRGLGLEATTGIGLPMRPQQCPPQRDGFGFNHKQYRARSVEPTQLVIDVTTADGRQSGLLHPSAVKCEQLMTIHQQLIDRTIGRLSASLMAQIDGCLKASLDLP